MHFGSLGGWEWVIIFTIFIIVFGVGKVPKAIGDLGKSLKEFKNAVNNGNQED